MDINSLDWSFPYPAQKMPVMARNVVSTSQPLATQAGLDIMRQGGNAVDAAIATAITLTVVEPVMNGIGGDLFVQVWHEGKLYGLCANGQSPAAWSYERFKHLKQMPSSSWDSVVVPGQVAGWVALSERFGQLPFAKLFSAAIHYAREGFMVTPQIARIWAPQIERFKNEPGFIESFSINGQAPKVGELWKFPAQAGTLEEIAQTKGQSFYHGKLAQKIVDFSNKTGGCLSLEDLSAMQVEWVEPLSQTFKAHTLHEIPPSGQGIAALMALGILNHFEIEDMGKDSAQYYHVMIESMKLAFADLHHHIADQRHMKFNPARLLDPHYLEQRAQLIHMDQASHPVAGAPKTGGTVYLSSADSQGTMVSFIQSNFFGFGSGVVEPSSGIALHARGMGFVIDPNHVNCVAPKKKPLHTIIPGFITHNNQALMAFGVMGGSMQAQGHLQMVSRLAAFKQNPQAMSDAPRFRVEAGPIVHVESHLPINIINQLISKGHHIVVAPRDSLEFGSAQLILKTDQGYIGASDSRRDGTAAGF